MAAFDNFVNMYDIALKPRLLRSLIKENLPDEKHPFRCPSELSKVVSAIKTHGLLSESFTESTDVKQIENWKSAVDAWIDRLLILLSSNMVNFNSILYNHFINVIVYKCWAGICLLGLTCQECSSDRFLASYSVWFHKLLLHIQPPADSHFVKVASCASISDLLTRLGGFLNVKKDGTSHSGKLIQPVLKLLNEDSSEAVWEGAVYLICTIITFFPSSIHRHYDSAEAAIVSKIMSGKCSVNMLKKFAHCLALLPKSKGDDDSWSIMMQKILLSINIRLNDAFLGLEEESKCIEAVRLLVPPGKDPPPPLGHQTIPGDASDKATKRSEKLLMSSVSTLMLCCCTMLTTSYPVQVSVPVRPLLALVGRVLMVDGSLSQTLLPFMTAVQQEFICPELPVLHLYSLELLTAIIKGVRSQLLPHAADIVRLLTEYFRRCELPELRIKVYSIIRVLLISMGVGMAVYLAQEVINNTFVDLDFTGHESGGTSSSAYSKASTEALLHPYHRKRKHVTTTGSLEQHDRVGLEVEAPKNYPTTPISVKIAALEALEALLSVGGTLRSESWRSNVDLLLITVAANACKGGWANEEKNIFLASEPSSTWADFQLAALHALLASLLSPARVRPPYLAQGFELFRRGKQETGTKLAEFCAHALLALEVLIHPRALPLVDFTSANHNSFDEGINRKFPEIMYSGSQKYNTQFSSATLGMGLGDPDPDEDDLYASWLANGDEIEVPMTDLGKNMNNSEEPSETFRDPCAEKPLAVDGSFSTKIPEESELGPAAGGADVGMGGDGDEIMVELQQFEEPIKQLQEPISRESATVPAVIGGSTSAQIELGRDVKNSDALDLVDSEMALGNDDFAAKGDTGGVNTPATISNSDKSKGFVAELDHDSSMDSFPDIVDGDPDSD